jgi:hypothetical protein
LWLISDVGHVFVWPAACGVAVIGTLLCMIGLAMFVTLFSHDDKRAQRAYRVFRDLLCLFRRFSR